MYNLYDIMQAAQGGQAMGNLARQFGLSVEQSQRAVEALLPGFSVGLQRNAHDPFGFASTLGMMGSGRFTPFFDQPGAAQTANAMAQGNAVMEQIFGKPEVARQVAAHAGVLSGVSTEVLLRMLPIIGAMIMGGLFKAAMSQGFGGVLAQVNETMQRSDGPKVGAPATPSGDPTALFGQMMQGMMTGMAPAARTAPTAPPPSEPEPATEADGASAFDPAQVGLGQISRMFEAGRDVQKQQLEAMQSIFESLLGKKPK